MRVITNRMTMCDRWCERSVVVGVELTRRNLEVLLYKFNGNSPDSACTIVQDGVFVKAVEDAVREAAHARYEEEDGSLGEVEE